MIFSLIGGAAATISSGEIAAIAMETVGTIVSAVIGVRKVLNNRDL